MPHYIWRCLHCGKEIEVARSIDKSDVGPLNCETCQHTSFEKLLQPATITGRKEKGYYNSQKKGRRK